MSEAVSFGKYTVVERLGVGGMAEVFKCRLHGLGGFDKVVVVKRIHDAYLSEPEFLNMFLDEARLAANLHHPNIVQVYEIDEVDGVPYIAMEYVRGPTLHAMGKAARDKGRFEPGIFAKIVSQLCDGLHHAHQATDSHGEPLQLIHRDVSPVNVVVSTEGIAKLLDFGVARARGRLAHTEAGTLKGKLRYTAPEQLKKTEIDHRVDVFAAGMVLYELTTGRVAYDGKTEPELLRAVFENAIIPPSEVIAGYPEMLEQIVLNALAGNPDARYQTALDMHLALERFVATCDPPVNIKSVASFVQELFPNGGENNTFGGSAPSTSMSGRRAGTPGAATPGSRSGSRPGSSLRALSTPPPSSRPRTPMPVVPSTAPAEADAVSNLDAELETDADGPRPRRGLKIGLGAAAAVAALALAFLLLRQPATPRATAPNAEPQRTAEPSRRDDEALRAYLEEIERLAKARQWGPAVALLEKAQALKASDAALNIRLARLSDEVERDALIARATAQLRNADTAGAVETVKRVLDRDPENAQALALLQQAKGKQGPPPEATSVAAAGAAPAPAARGREEARPRPAREGRLTVTSEPDGTVYLDDEPIGRTPLINHAVREGRHGLEIRLEGHVPHERTVDVLAGKLSAVAVVLKAAVSKRLAAVDLTGTDVDASKPPRDPEPVPAPAPSAPPEPHEAPPFAAPPPAVTSGPTSPPPEPAPAAAGPAAYKPRLPARHEVRSTKDLMRALQIIESETMKGGVKPEVARDVTFALARELSKRIGPAEAVELYPRATYDLVVRLAAKGESQASIGEKLRAAHLSGELRAAATP